jgi:hypothetical protein
MHADDAPLAVCLRIREHVPTINVLYMSGTPRSGVAREPGQYDGGHSPPYGPAVLSF